MGVVTLENEVATPVPAPTVFKAFAHEFDNIVPKAAPHIIKSVDTVQGSGGPGTTKQAAFAEGGEFKKFKIEGIDPQNMIYTYSLMEVEKLDPSIEKITGEIKVSACGDGGSTIKKVAKFYPKAGSKLDVEKLKAEEQKAMGFFKALEAHLKQAN